MKLFRALCYLGAGIWAVVAIVEMLTGRAEVRPSIIIMLLLIHMGDSEK